MEKRSSHWFDWPGLIFLAAALGFCAGRLEITGWVEGLFEVDYSIFLGFILGTFLGFSIFKRRTVGWMVLFYGVVNEFWQVGRLMGDQVAWSDRVLIIISRLRHSIVALVNLRPVNDPILFLTGMILLFWFLGFSGSFEYIRNGKPWFALGMATLCVLIVDQYPPSPADRVFIDGAFFLFGILFLGRAYFILTRNEWEFKGMKLDLDVGPKSLLMLIGIISCTFLIGWNLPLIIQTVTPGSEMQHGWAELWKPLNDRFVNVFASLRNNQAQNISGVFQNQLSLGTSVPDGEEELFRVHVSDPLPEGLNYYWRVRSYDNYQDGMWSSSITPHSIDSSGITFSAPAWMGRTSRVIDVEINKTMASMPVSNYPIFINYPYILDSASVDFVNSPAGSWEDILFLSPQKALQAGDHYRASTLIDTPDTTQLQNASSYYPDQIKKYYLQLPPNFSPRVTELALNLTKKFSSPYEKINGITEYIRQTIIYADTISAPPKGQDPVDWVLFDLKKGFCYYDASAEVLMLRSIGIASRVVVGYAQGAPLPDGGYKIREKDVHAWVEAYFNDLGWVEFEPTPIQPQRQYPAPPRVKPAPVTTSSPKITPKFAEGNLEKTPQLAPSIPPTEITPWELIQRILFYLFITAIFVAVCRLIASYYKNKIFHHISPAITAGIIKIGAYLFKITPPFLLPVQWYLRAKDIERLFWEVRWMLLLMGERVAKSQTPQEQANLLLRYVPEGEVEMKTLLNAFQESRFSEFEGNRNDAQKARDKLWRLVISNRAQRWLNIKMRI